MMPYDASTTSGPETTRCHSFSVPLSMTPLAPTPTTTTTMPICIAQAILTLGEVYWSPRQTAWTATLAPAGREGVFLAVAAVRESLTPAADWWVTSW